MGRCIILLMSFTFSMTITEGVIKAYDRVKIEYVNTYGEDYAIPAFLADQFFEITYVLNWCEDQTDCERNKVIDKYTMQSVESEDRIPTIFLKDWANSFKRYEYNGLRMSTFGWCSEKEMSYCTLLELLGYDCKIYQSGNHVVSKIWFKDEELIVDNTFGFFYTNRLNGMSKEDWLNDYGIGEERLWYNQMVRESIEPIGRLQTDNYFVSRLVQLAFSEVKLMKLD